MLNLNQHSCICRLPCAVDDCQSKWDNVFAAGNAAARDSYELSFKIALAAVVKRDMLSSCEFHGQTPNATSVALSVLSLSSAIRCGAQRGL